MVLFAYITQPGSPMIGFPSFVYANKNIAPGSTGAPVGDNLRPGRCLIALGVVIIRIDAHAAGTDNKIGALIQPFLDCLRAFYPDCPL